MRSESHSPRLAARHHAGSARRRAGAGASARQGSMSTSARSEEFRGAGSLDAEVSRRLRRPSPARGRCGPHHRAGSELDDVARGKVSVEADRCAVGIGRQIEATEEPLKHLVFDRNALAMAVFGDADILRAKERHDTVRRRRGTSKRSPMPARPAVVGNSNALRLPTNPALNRVEAAS